MEARMWWIILAVVLGGAAISLQAPINASLARELGAPVPAAAVSFGVGFLVLFAIALVQGHGPAFARLTQVPVWIVGSLGVVTLVAALIFGQMAAALVIDATGILGMAVREVTPTRIAAAVMVLGGLILSRL
jgi:transporter family-2 protein